MPKVIIADSSAIICLGKNGYLHILKEMYGEIFIPEAVFLEVMLIMAKTSLLDVFFNLVLRFEKMYNNNARSSHTSQ